MKFWSSLEVSPGAEERLSEIRKAVDNAINKNLARVTISNEWTDWEWAFIVTMFAPDVILDYPERVRRSNKNKCLEFRLRADYQEFVAAPRERQVEIVFEQLHRAVNLMEKYKMTTADRSTLHSLLDAIRPNIP